MKALKIIYYLFIACIAVIALLLVVSVVPITGNIKFMIVQSGSMEPAIHTGSIVMVKPFDSYKIGDIVTFGPYSKTRPATTHRIVEIKVQDDKEIYITKGDANNAPDTREIQKREIIGKVLVDVPYAGYAVAAAKRPAGFIVIIVVPAIIVIYDELQKIWAEIKKRSHPVKSREAGTAKQLFNRVKKEEDETKTG